MMTKKDHQKLADILGGYLHNLHEKGPETAGEWLEEDITRMLEKDNPRFDRVRFFQAISDAQLMAGGGE